MMVEEHDDFICRVLAESPPSSPRIILETCIILVLIVTYIIQYRHTLKSPHDENNTLPRSYVVFAALFALFQLCDYFVDDIYGIGFEGTCPDALSKRRIWETTGGAWLLGVQILGALGLCVVYTIRSRRQQKQLDDATTDTEEAGLSPTPRIGSSATEETPLLSPPAEDESSATAREQENSSSGGDNLAYPAILILSTITTFLLLLLLILCAPEIDIGILLPVLGILTSLFLLIVPFLSIPPFHTYATNLTLTIVLTLLTLWLPALYASTLTWAEMGWVGLGRNLAIYMLRLPVLILASLFLFLQHLSIFRRFYLAHDNGLSLPSVVVMLVAQTAMLGVLMERAEKRWRVERLWCELSEREPGWWAGCEVQEGHVWGEGRFWVFSAQARMLYSTALMVVVLCAMWWRRAEARERVNEEEQEEVGRID